MTPASLGSDTGGSIRQPAALTGTVGVKPTYGRVSRYGLIAFASSLDQVGVFANDVASAARVLEVIGGHDPRDATSLPGELRGLIEGDAPLEGLRVGVPEEYFGEGIEPGVAGRVREALRRAVERGASLVPLSMPHTRYAVATYYVIATAEASSNLARFDGVRFGLRADAGSLGELYTETRERGFGAEVKRRILLGTYVLSAGYYEAYYLRAQKVRTLIRRDFDAAFAKVDVVASPTSPTVAFPLGERTADPLSMYMADVCTLPASLAGLPALSLPCGTAPPPGGTGALPVGLQLVAPPLGEPALFRAARGFEAALG
jgi:aspartyl-tRNA(Asn)/glutamyl-tRNA(Gln) amidotransferase subunit A